ncbi:MAG: glycoside hydrolase family 3 C-terminal domain-containing protein, partial [Lachnospiraceae bacterium]|nr:glycoside hydrolase family 3 C-terminal domain-containing protein [Lachnospiraceae bacterium]
MAIAEYEREHINYLRAHLAECTVLLKSNGDFPIESPCEIALYGSGARRTVKGGTGSGEVNSRSYETVERALKRAGFTITTSDWLDAYDEIYDEAHRKFVRDIKEQAKHSSTSGTFEMMGVVMPEPEYYLPVNGLGEVAVYVLSRISGEGNDRNPVGGDILLSGPEIRDITAIRKKYKKFLLILNVGGPVDLSPVIDTKNILVLSQLGAGTGTAVADILLGKANPSGKLATTWAAWEDYPTVGDFGDKNNTHYTEGVYVGYRYFDSTGIKPLFPFGYGKSYTTFEMKDAKVKTRESIVSVNVNIKNTGKMKGKEVAQVYVSVPSGKLDQPYQTLAAFGKTKELEPGEAETLTMEFGMEDIASYSVEKESYLLEAGDYVV